MTIVKQPPDVPRCVLCHTIENVAPIGFAPDAMEFLHARCGVTPGTLPNQGICARCETLPRDERRALAEMNVRSVGVEIMVSVGIPLDRARCEVANMDL